MGTQSTPEGSGITPEPSRSTRVSAHMKKLTVSIGLAVVLAFPAGAVAKPHPDNADKRAAKAECKTLRGNTTATREAFRTLHRSFAACVRKTAVEEAQEEQTAHKNAAKECKALRQSDPAAFAEQYGDRPNAYGKCVSSKAKEKEAEADEEDEQEATAWRNAAKECKNLRETDQAAFSEQYGDRPNAFGKCVSSKARENEGETETA
jgi:hypothetical protein